MNVKFYLPAVTLAAVAVGCATLPSVGPDYKPVEYKTPGYRMPDAGYPTSNLTATCEYAPAVSNKDNRVVVSKNLLDLWWKRFNDPVLTGLVDGAVSNNVSFLMARYRLEQANWELLGSYAAYEQVLAAVSDYEKGNLRLRAVLASLQK